MKMKQSSQSLISTGMLPCGIDQWLFISSVTTLMMLVCNPISSSESMNCLRALTWKSRPSHLDQINTIYLSLTCLGYRKDQIPSGAGEWRPAPGGPGHLCAPWDAPAELQPLPHRGLLCCLGHHPPGAAPHWTPSAAGRPGCLPGTGDGRGRLCPGKDNLTLDLKR